MSDILYCLIIEPVVFFLDFLISILKPLLCVNPVASLLYISLIVNFLCYPFFKKAAEVSQADRKRYFELLPKLNSIKENFKGSERRMLVATYFRQNHYSPILSNLKQSMVVLLQVPIFLAMYVVIDHYSFLSIPNIGPEGYVWQIFSLKLRVLPIVMTLINLISLYYYEHNIPLKEKKSAVALPILFLVLLYKSNPAIVIYWIFNNIFSVLTNVKIFAPARLKQWTIGFVIIVTAFVFQTTSWESIKITLIIWGVLALMAALVRFIFLKDKELFWLGTMTLCIVAMISKYFYETYIHYGYILATMMILVGYKFYVSWVRDKITDISYKDIFLLVFPLGGLFLYILASLIASDPIDFSSAENISALMKLQICTVLGSVVLYPCLIYAMFPYKRKVLYYTLGVLLFVSLLKLCVFEPIPGYLDLSMTINSTQQTNLTMNHIVKDTLMILFVMGIFSLIIKYNFRQYLNKILVASILSLLILCAHDVVQSENYMREYTAKLDKNLLKEFKLPLSKTHKNIVIIFLDRAMSTVFPITMNEYPEMKKVYDGFTYYPNTLSYAAQTLYSTPSMFGGYEYTPQKLNADTSRRMVDKHDESFSVLPELFRRNGAKVIVNGLPFISYDDRKEFDLYHKDIEYYSVRRGIERKTQMKQKFENEMKIIHRNAFIFSLFRLAPEVMRQSIYNVGLYLTEGLGNNQHKEVLAIIEKEALKVLTKQTYASDIDKPTFTIFDTELPHSPTAKMNGTDLLKKYPFKQRYVPAGEITKDMHRHYAVNVMSYELLAEWLQKLKKEEVYDNTKIIMIADHGWLTKQMLSVRFEYTVNNPLLLIKDFNAKGEYNIDYRFMTLADLPVLATENMIKNPKNPFTGKELTMDEKENGVDIINNYQIRWSPRQFADKDRTYLIPKEQYVYWKHIDKEGIPNIRDIEKYLDK